MPNRFAQIAFTPAVAEAQSACGSREANERLERLGPARDTLAEEEEDFIAACDSFFLASVGETGWPYMQHRGGPKGFLRVIDKKTIGFSDFRGNRELITVGNLSRDDRVELLIIDYPRRARLKILGHARVLDPQREPALAARLAVPRYKAQIERLFVIRVEAFDWNCKQHITPRYTREQLRAPLSMLLSKIGRVWTRIRHPPPPLPG